MTENKGIIVNGGHFESQNTAVGDNASIHSTVINNAGLQQLAALLDELLPAIAGVEEKAVPNKQAIVAAAGELQQEIRKEKPDGISIKKIGLTVLENLKYVKDIVPIAQSVYHYISHFLTTL